MKKITIYHVLGLPLIGISFYCFISYISQNGIILPASTRNTNFSEEKTISVPTDSTTLFVATKK